MANRNVDQSDMFVVSSSTSRLICCRCSRTVSGADQQLVPVPFCARHYVCRSCFLYSGGMSYCPGCVVVSPSSSVAVVDSRRSTVTWTHADGALSRLNGAHDLAATAKTDANGNGPSTTTYDVCQACGRRTEHLFYCQSCTDVESSARPVCQSCWQQHQLDFHALARLRLGAVSTPTTTTSSPELQLCISSQLQQVPVDDRQRLVASSTSNASSVLRQIRPRMMLSTESTRDDQSLSSLLGGLVMHASNAVESSLVVSSSAGGLLAGGLHEPAARHRRLVGLQAPLSRQYEGWLWQALNNGGFEQAVQRIDERKQHIAVNLQSILRDMEFRLERARGVLDELFRDYMRQAIEVSRCQMEALQVQSESLQRVRAAAARLQHARVYDDKTRALLAETDLASILRHNAASTCLRPCDDGWIEFRSPSDDELRAYLRSACTVDSRVVAGHCSVQSVDREVNCLSWTVVGRLSEFDVQLRNHCHAAVDDAGLSVLISDCHGAELNYDYQRRSAGHYVVRYRAQSPGTHHIYVLLHDRHLADSPYTVCVPDGVIRYKFNLSLALSVSVPCLTLSSPVVSNGYTTKCSKPYWSNPPFLFF